MSSGNADRNLLLGILGYQNAFITKEQLLAGMQAWLYDKARPLAEILRDQGALDEPCRNLLDALVDRHVQQHGGDPQQSLQAVSSAGSVRKDLERLPDPDLQASIVHLSRAKADDDPYATKPPSAGAATSAGTRFLILRPHAKGGLGQVYIALDTELNREVALKEIQDKHADNAGSRARFLLEAEITGGLEHPSIVPVYGLGTYADGRPFYAMRFIKGDSLMEAIKRYHRGEPGASATGDRTLELHKLLRRLIDVCNALQYAHDRDVLHRDIKPGNIMLGKYGETLVVDWGLAKAEVRSQGSGVGGEASETGPHAQARERVEAPLRPASGSGSAETVAGSAIGTPAYMSPEQAEGRLDLLGPASDVYGLGATLYTLLTGIAPADGPLDEVLKKVRTGDIPTPRRLDASIDPALEAVCLKAMALRIADRYGSLRQMADDLEHWLAGEPVSAWPEPVTIKLRRWVARHRTPVAAAAALLLAALPLLTILYLLSEGARENLEHANKELEKEQGKTTDALVAVTTAQQQRALAQVNALRVAAPGGVPGILADLEANRATVLPQLRVRFAEEGDRAKRMRLALALLPVEPHETRDQLVAWMLQTKDPAETLLVRDALRPHAADLTKNLWREADDPTRARAERFRALVALASFDAASPRWQHAAAEVVEELLTANALHLGSWVQALQPVRLPLLSPLGEVFRGERLPELRQVAANVLADYAADQPQVLADLLMDADEKQFTHMYPLVEKRKVDCVAELNAEIDKKPVIVKDKIVLETKGMIAEDDAKVKTSSGLLPAKRFEVCLQAGKSYRLTMDSQELDSFLVLQDKTGKELAFDDDGGGGLNSLLLYTAPTDGTYTVFAASFKGTGAFLLKVVETMAGDGGKEKLAKRQANAAVALLKMNQPERVWPLLKHSSDPRLRSYLIHGFGPAGADAKAIVKRLNEEANVTIRRALILSLGGFAEKEWSADDRNAVTKNLQEIYLTAADPGVHAASEWLQRSWKQEAWLKKVNDEWAEDKEQREQKIESIRRSLAKGKDKASPQWYVNGQGQTMVVIPALEPFMMGSPPKEAGRFDYEIQHKRRIGRTFALAAKPVTMGQILKMRKNFFGNNEASARQYAPTDDCPALGISWHAAAEYCNWLSKEDGIDDPEQWCYEIKGQVAKLKKNYLSLSGYRLPTEAEMEFATRAGAVTSRYYGETEELLPKYAWYQKNSKERAWPVGSLKPNDFGLFDVHGNVFTWCQDWKTDYPAGKGEEMTEDQEQKDGLVARNRVLRGGAFSDFASLVRSAHRNNDGPTFRSPIYGFRLARTFTP